MQQHTNTQPSPAHDGYHDRKERLMGATAIAGPMTSPPVHRWRAFSLLAVAAFMTVMDLTIVNTALPTIGRQLRFSQTSLLWVVTAYGLAYGGFLLLVGRAADLLGRRRMIIVCLGVFTAASL